MNDAATVLRAAARRLAEAGVPEPMRDATRLLGHAAGREVRYSEVSSDILERFQGFVDRRCQREPVSHILGKRDFWTSGFAVSSAVLDPRPETETLVEAALDAPFLRVLDLGTGSGAIILSLLKESPASCGVATDISDDALRVAATNAAHLELTKRVDFLRSDWFDAVTGCFDLIVSNPPYIAADEMDGLAPELSYEPRMALTDEGDGLSAYRAIAAGAPAHLDPGGRLMVEIGPTQADAVGALFDAAGLGDIRVIPDLDGRDRVVAARAI